MSRRIGSILLLAAVLAASLGAAAVAQTTNVPDEGVRGSGSIKTSAGNIGNLGINVARSGTVLFGGFKYVELASTNIRGHTIYSQQITGLKISGNSATITAVGFWNGMLSDLTVEVLDDLKDDWFHIVAKPRGMILIIYDQAGGLIDGDIQVYSTPLPEILVKGEGTIAVGKNIGKFSVSAQKTGDIVEGTIYYVEYNPYSMSIVERPRVRIYVPQVVKLVVDGFDAFLVGKGTLNGKPAMVEVKAKDGQLYPTFIYAPDEFHIKATPLSTDSLSRIGYEAGGELTSGEITIRLAAFR